MSVLRQDKFDTGWFLNDLFNCGAKDRSCFRSLAGRFAGLELTLMEVLMKPLKPLTLFVIFACALSTLPLRTAPSIVHAQSIVGRISGTVTDTSGGVIRGTTVKVINDATASSRSAVADDAGFYVITNLPPGNYS